MEDWEIENPDYEDCGEEYKGTLKTTATYILFGIVTLFALVLIFAAVM